jgi:hypothetical protein
MTTTLDQSNLRIISDSDPGNGHGHRYIISNFDASKNSKSLEDPNYCCLLFQNGPVKEVGINGITNEALIAVILHRLNCFQNSHFKCRENALAITKLEEALHWLNHRTVARQARGVEGTSTP